jgi:hypothetical protein
LECLEPPPGAVYPESRLLVAPKISDATFSTGEPGLASSIEASVLRKRASLAEAKTTVPETEVILLDILAVLNRHAHCPNLLDQYVAARRHCADPIARFHECVEGIIRNRAIGNRHVERAMAIMEARYRDETLTQAKAAALVGLSPSDFSTRFKTHRHHVHRVPL